MGVSVRFLRLRPSTPSPIPSQPSALRAGFVGGGERSGVMVGGRGMGVRSLFIFFLSLGERPYHER